MGFLEICEPSSKLSEPEVGIMGTSDLQPVGQQYR